MNAKPRCLISKREIRTPFRPTGGRHTHLAQLRCPSQLLAAVFRQYRLLHAFVLSWLQQGRDYPPNVEKHSYRTDSSTSSPMPPTKILFLPFVPSSMVSGLSQAAKLGSFVSKILTPLGSFFTPSLDMHCSPLCGSNVHRSSNHLVSPSCPHLSNGNVTLSAHLRPHQILPSMRTKSTLASLLTGKSTVL